MRLEMCAFSARGTNPRENKHPKYPQANEIQLNPNKNLVSDILPAFFAQ